MNFDKLKNLMDHFVENDYAPGNTIKVYLDGKQIFDYSCGYSDLDNETPMSGNEHFFLYSCSKITTVTAALQLFEQGKFLLNDPLYDYIPEYKEMYIKARDGKISKAQKPITIKNLFNMTAGLTYDITTPAYSKARELTSGKMDTTVVARCLAEDYLAFEPGERFCYSMCHDVLAALVEIITGKKFRDYVKENIFDPLEMNDSAFHLTPEIEKNMACQYQFVSEDNGDLDIVDAQKFGRGKIGTFKNVGLIRNLVFGEEYDSGGAGVITTVSDYMKLAAALANYGTGLNAERILSPYTVDLMRTNTLDEKQMVSFNWEQLRGYGYGLGVRTMMDRAKGGSLSNIGEFGWGGAAGASVYIDPEINLAVVYAKHSLNPREEYYQPRVRNAVYACL